MSSARTPRHSAGDALPAPPRCAHPRTHTHAHAARTRAGSPTQTHPHQHPTQPHSAPRPCGGHAATSSLPADAQPEGGSAHTRPPCEWERRGDTRTHAHHQQQSLRVPPGSPEMEAAGWWSHTHGHARSCTAHPPLAQPFRPSREPREGAVSVLSSLRVPAHAPLARCGCSLSPTPGWRAQRCPQENRDREESAPLTPLTFLHTQTPNTRGLRSLSHSPTCTHLPRFNKTFWWVLNEPTLAIRHNHTAVGSPAARGNTAFPITGKDRATRVGGVSRAKRTDVPLCCARSLLVRGKPQGWPHSWAGLPIAELGTPG